MSLVCCDLNLKALLFASLTDFVIYYVTLNGGAKAE